MPQLKQLSCAHSGGGGLGVGGWENWEAVGKAAALFPPNSSTLSQPKCHESKFTRKLIMNDDGDGSDDGDVVSETNAAFSGKAGVVPGSRGGGWWAVSRGRGARRRHGHTF